MKLKQFFEKLSIPAFLKFLKYQAYEEIDKPQDDPNRYDDYDLKKRIETINKEDSLALQNFLSLMVSVQNDPEFWADVIEYAKKDIGDKN